MSEFSLRVVTGTQDGELLVYNASNFEKQANEKLELCCINSVVFHPIYEALIYCCGERSFFVDDPSDDEEHSTNQGHCRSALKIKKLRFHDGNDENPSMSD